MSQLESHRRLLNEFASRYRAAPLPLLNQFDHLLEDFESTLNQAQPKLLRAAEHDVDEFRDLLFAFAKAKKQFQEQQEETADDFNLLEVLQLTHNEIRHSMVLAWLLDRDMDRAGTHAQDNLGFRLFLKEFKLPIRYAKTSYRVRREVVGDRSRIDIEVVCRGEFIIHIENKVWSPEGDDETRREWADLQARLPELQLEHRPVDVHALYLTPDGHKANCEHFASISWGRIARVVDRFAELAKPADVRLFAAHYARTLWDFIATNETRNGAIDGETTDE